MTAHAPSAPAPESDESRPPDDPGPSDRPPPERTPTTTPRPADPARAAVEHLALAAPAVASTEPLSPDSRDGAESRDDVTDDPELVVVSMAASDSTDATHVHVQEQVDGIDVVGAVSSITVDADGRVVHSAERRADDARRADDGSTGPALSATDAVRAAAEALGLTVDEPVEVVSSDSGPDRRRVVSPSGIARSDIDARLVWMPLDDGSTRLAWELMIDEIERDHWWLIRIDAASRAELDRFDMVHHYTGPIGDHTPRSAPTGNLPTRAPGVGLGVDALAAPVIDGSSYLVFPGESPIHGTGSRTTFTNPAESSASPFGWHDLDGMPGPDTTDTSGNNVDVGTDRNGFGGIDPGGRASGGAGLDFTPGLNLATGPSDDADAGVVNAFYWGNRMHDVLYAYGFDEAAGNFQWNNYGAGGVGGDPVVIETQDSADFAPSTTTRNNANFATAPDGFPARMQLFLFSLGSPERDSALDAGVITHEYAHGLSVRLTGGPAVVDCLDNAEQAGEGWSDVISMLMTPDASTRERGVGNYVVFSDADDPGIRGLRYTEAGDNPWSYADLSSIPAEDEHRIGSRWAQALWAAHWLLVDEHGFAPDIADADAGAGNTILMQLIVDALKLQPCNPGLVDARDAILQADTLANGGANRCLLWTAFAAHGLGIHADQGDPDRLLDTNGFSDQTASFELPLNCDGAIGAVTPLSPSRLLDTRPGATTDDGIGAGGGRLPAGGQIAVAVAGRGGVPGDARAVVVNATAVQPATTGFFTVHGCEGQVPTASSLNFAAGSNVANEIVVELDDDGRICLFTSTASHALVDVVGFVDADSPLRPVTPTRLLDSRAGIPLATGQEIEVQVGGSGGVPTNATAAIVNIGAVRPEMIGFVTVHPCLASPPVTSSLNHVGGVNRANEIVAPLDPTGKICIFTSSPTHLIVDVSAYVPAGANITTIQPTRILDTRTNSFVGRLDGGDVVEIGIAGFDGIPPGARAAFVNVTAVRPGENGFASVFPCDVLPATSSLNFSPGVNSGNDLIAGLSTDGSICIFVSAPVDLTVDISGSVD